jgi:hypothetical protein
MEEGVAPVPGGRLREERVKVVFCKGFSDTLVSTINVFVLLLFLLICMLSRL